MILFAFENKLMSVYGVLHPRIYTFFKIPFNFIDPANKILLVSATVFVKILYWHFHLFFMR